MPARILEISHLPWVKMALPEQTEHIDTSFATLSGQGTISRLVAAGKQMARLCRLTLQPPSEVIFCRCFGRFIYRPDHPVPVNALRWLMGWLIEACVRSQVRRGARLAVVDHLDETTLVRRDLALLRRCTRYFKRELPQNVWNVFLAVQPRHSEYYNLQFNPAFESHVKKLRPLSIGISAQKIRLIAEAVSSLPDREKTIDVFYAGPITHSTVRSDGWLQLEELRRRGLRIDVRTGGLPFEEYVRRMCGAWLVWSPEGHGWECYRHYEACVAGSVPLINYPTIRRSAPLVDGLHCVFYAVDGDDLCRRAEWALKDQAALRRMAVAARAHVLDQHTQVQQGLRLAREMLPDISLAPRVAAD